MKLDNIKSRNIHANFQGLKAMVVGGTAGIGEAIAKRLAQAQFDVIIVGRNKDRGHEIVLEMETINPTGKYDFLPLDVQYIKNIHGIAENYKQLDRLVLTQGILTTQGRKETSEGIDQKLSLHYYSRMAFIQEFLPLLRASTNSPRVLSVLSGGKHSSFPLYQQDPELKENYSLSNAATAAGFYNDLMLDSYSTDPENNTIAFAHSAPGIVNTDWGNKFPFFINLLFTPLKLFAKTPADCAELMSDFLLNPSVLPGFYVFDQYGQPATTTQLHTIEAKD
ncbi:FabG domain-containing protein, partial [Thraustotheca clavata]